ncbi:MAG: hypothetical protein RIS54_709 [Verrucomicrobiota bacterium]|jgi:AraC-like DNA-binding protein
MSRSGPLITESRRIPTAGLHPSVGGISLAGHLRASVGIGHETMRVLGNYAVVYLLGGGGQFADGLGRRQPVRAGDLMVVFPDVPHEYGPEPGGEWDEIYFVFNGPVFAEWRAAGLLDPREPVWHAEPVAAWHRRLRDVCREPGEGPAAALLELGRLQGVLADLRAAWRPRLTRQGDEPPAWLDAVCRELERPEAAPDPAQLAARAGISYERFRKRFAELKGVPPARYRLLRLVDEACLRLAADERPLRAIATELGFCDEFHFSKLFKQRTGLSPSAYRRQTRR